MHKKWIIASGNAGKIREFQSLFSGLPVEIVGQECFDISEVEETGLSFVENAILKARNAARCTGLPAIADDSGLEVDALNGEPGIYSARYSRDGVAHDSAIDDVTDASNNQKLLEALAGVSEDKRTARFVCALAFMRHASDPTPTLALGEWQGRILFEERGAQGFGYDPLFYVPEYQCSSAELDRDIKNRLSHRAQAMKKMVEALRHRGLWPAV